MREVLIGAKRAGGSVRGGQHAGRQKERRTGLATHHASPALTIARRGRNWDGESGACGDIEDMADQLELHPASLASLHEPLLTAAEAATLLAVRRSWIYDAARSGQLPCIRVGRHVRFLRSDLGRWVSSQRT